MRTFNQISQKLLLSGFWDFAKEVKECKKSLSRASFKSKIIYIKGGY